MPSNYALHRFGSDAIQNLPPEQRRPAQRFRRLYNGGLHGADLFFYSGDTAQLAACRNMTGAEFFARACEWLRKNPSEGGTACLYGLLGYYCLRSCLAPLIAREAEKNDLHPLELEVELDRYLLGLDGKTPAHRQDLSHQLDLTRGECVTISGFFPPADGRKIHTASRRMAFWLRRMAAGNRWLTRLLLAFSGKELRLQLMPDHADHRCMHLDVDMLGCYEQALALYPEMAEALNAHARFGIPLGEEFFHPFA